MFSKYISLKTLILLMVVIISACNSDDNNSQNIAINCSTDSHGPADNDGENIIYSAPCGTYGSITSWLAYPSINQLPVSGQAINAEIKYMVHMPEDTAKALVILFAGGIGDTGINGDTQTGEVQSSGRNFLVRSAQLFADNGYLALTIDRPSITADIVSAFGDSAYDEYRISHFHTLDLVTVVNEVNIDNLDVFFAGTSRGAISAYTQHRLAEAISLSSPVTSGSRLHLNYVTNPINYPQLQSSYVSTPTHILANLQDGCSVSTHDNALILSNAINSAMAVSSIFDDDFSGNNGLGNISSNPCKARTYHGFLGIENAAIAKISTWMDTVLSTLDNNNQKPLANNDTVTINTNSSTAIDINLAGLVSDGDANETLSFELWDNSSIYGANLVLNGSIVTYTPPTSVIQNYQDSFVYLVRDDNGGAIDGAKTGYGKINVNLEI